MADKPSLHSKLAQVMYEASRIPKNGTAPQSMGGFKFVEVGDAADVIRKALAEKSVSMLPSAIELIGETEHSTKSGGTMTTMTVRTTWTLTDGESGETAVIQSIGSGADTGDKASPKAQTSAMKYALLMGFLLSTGDEPERYDVSDRSSSGAAASAPPPAAAPVPPEETETLLGPISRVGAIVKGAGRNSDLEWRETPDGYHIGFLLEVGDGKPRPQVVIEGDLAVGLFAASNMAEPALAGERIEVDGDVYEVRVPGRKMIYRIKAKRIVFGDYIIPADIAPGQAELALVAD